MLEGYLHALLKSILGTYVDLNEEAEALRVSVWEGQVELRELKLKLDAFEPLLAGLPFTVAFGCIGYFKLQVPLINLGGQPIQIHVQDIFLLLRPRGSTGGATSPSPSASAMAAAMQGSSKAATKAYMLQAKRTTLQALELEAEKATEASPAQSTFMSRLLTKLLDNLQVHIERVHIRLEDDASSSQSSFALGLTLDEMIVKSVDAAGEYTLQVRDSDAAACLRKVLEVKKLGVYWSASFEAITHDDQVPRFVAQMQNHFWDPTAPWLVSPITMTVRLLMNDRGVAVPLTPKAFSQRVIQRLGIPWLLRTADAIGADAWSAFVASMPPRDYSLTFVFCEAWALALDALDTDEVPTVEHFRVSLRSCLQWADVDVLAESVAAFHAAALRVVAENNTFLTVDMAVDRVAWKMSQSQYHGLLALASAVALERRKLPYKDLRPTTPVVGHAAAWWHFAIEAVLRDARLRRDTIDWARVHARNVQRARYIELYILLNDGSTGSIQGNVHWGEVMREFDDLEYAMESSEILKCRADAKKKIAAAKAPTPPPSSAAATPASMWSYSYWFGTATTPEPTPTSPTAAARPSVEQETQYLYNAINFNPADDRSMAATAAASTVQYRVTMALSECSVALGDELLTLHVTGMGLELLQRAKAAEVSVVLADFVLTEAADAIDGCCIARLPMATIMTLPDADQMSGVKLQACEAPLPLLSCKIELPPLDDAAADIRLSLVTQPVDVRLNLPFLLRAASFLAPPATVDLHELDNAAWANAKSFTQYSAAQLRQAIAQRTKVHVAMDVASPIITIVETRETPVANPVRLRVYLGHLKATSHVRSAPVNNATHERSREEFTARLPEDQLHDEIELSVRGAEIRVQNERPLLDRASIVCALKTSVMPDDPTIPLVKLHGHVDRICSHVTMVSVGHLQRLVESVLENLEHVTLPAPDMAPVTAAVSVVASSRPAAPTKVVPTADFCKLLQRVVVDGAFTVGVVDVVLYHDTPLVRLGLTTMTSQIVLRHFDRRLEFGLGSVCVEDFSRPDTPFMVKSSETASLIRLAVTIATLDRPEPEDPDAWAAVDYPQAWGESPPDLWQPSLTLPVSVDVALDALCVRVHRDTLARLLLFFCAPLTTPARVIPQPAADEVTSIPIDASWRPRLERHLSAWAVPLPPSPSRLSATDDSASYRTACGQSMLASPTYLEALQEVIEPITITNTPWLQVQLQFKSVELVLSTEVSDNAIVANVAVQGLYLYASKSPQTLAVAASLETVRVHDGHAREMLGAEVHSADRAMPPPAHPIHRQTAMLTVAYDAFGTDAFESSWHPGYAHGVSLCLRSPRICFLARFLAELQEYAAGGPLVEAMATLEPPAAPTPPTSTAVAPLTDVNEHSMSSFPSLALQIHDSVIAMPRHSGSTDAITFRMDTLVVHNEPSDTGSGRSTMDKVLRNARLTSMVVAATGLRVATTIHGRATSLLGGTRFDVALDLAHGTALTVTSTPIRFVCSQEQYAFLLTAPTSNLGETPPVAKLPPPSATSTPPPLPTAAARVAMAITIPEISMELCSGNSGYQPTSTGDLSMANAENNPEVVSMARLHLLAVDVTVRMADGTTDAKVLVREIVVSDSRRDGPVAKPYRSIIALAATDERSAVSLSASNTPPLTADAAPAFDFFPNESSRVLASPRPESAVPSTTLPWTVGIDLDGLTFYPSPFLQELGQFFVPAAPTDHVSNADSDIDADDAVELVSSETQSESSVSWWPHPALTLRFGCHRASIVLVEDLGLDDSRLLRLQWDASVTAQVDAAKGAFVDVVLAQVQASSKLQDLETDSILKPVQIQAALTYSVHSLAVHIKVDRVIVLRCGYMDYTTLCAALAALASPRATPPAVSDAPPAVPLPPSELEPPPVRRAVCYGDANIRLLLYSPRGYFQSKEALGYYSGHWRKYIMMPPVPEGYEASFEEMTFMMLPGPSSDSCVGDPIRFGDAVVLQDANGAAVAKYDALGASGYLGPEGGGGAFECRLWQEGTTIFNSDRTVVHYGDSVELEGITLYNPNPHVGGGKDPRATKARPLHGGYLMFNGVGDAPVAFALHSKDDDDAIAAAATSAPTPNARLQFVSGVVSVPGIRLTVLNDMNNMHLPLLHAEVIPLQLSLQRHQGMSKPRGSALLTLGMSLQAYNRRLAVWEPIVEESTVHGGLHEKGGVLCDACMYQEDTGHCPATPPCAFHTAKTALFTAIARRAFEAKQQIARDLLMRDATADDVADTLLVTVPSGIAVNVSRNNLHVLFHGIELFTQERVDSSRVETFGSNVYVDNQSGVPLAYAMVEVPSVPTTATATESGSRLQWTPVPTGSCLPTTMLAHEAPAGIVMAPMRRLLWLKGSGKPMLVPIEHGHKSCFQFQTDQPLLGETVAEKGTLILRVRSAVKLHNALGVPVELQYDIPRGGSFVLAPDAATYVPVQALKDGYVTLCPRLEAGQLDPSLPLAWRTLVAAAKKAPATKARAGVVVDTITFFWRAYPPANAAAHLPPYNVLVVASSVDMDLCFSLYAPLTIENLLPWPADYHLLYEAKDMKQEIAMGSIGSGDRASMCVVDMRQDVSIALSLAVPGVDLPRSKDPVWIFGPKLSSQRQWTTLSPNCVVVVDLCDPLQTNDRPPSSLGPVACRLYTEYWFIDRTGLSLHYDTPQGPLPPQRTASDPFFAGNPLTMASRATAVAVKVLDGTAQWTSTAIDLSAVGSRAPLRLERTPVGLNVGTRFSKHFSTLMGIAEEKAEAGASVEFALGFRLDQGPGAFSRTTVVTFTPRYLVVNRSAVAVLEVAQDGGAGAVALPPGATHFFHWHGDGAHRVQVRLRPPKGRPTMWSHTFEMAAVGDFVLKMHAPPPAHPLFPDCNVHDAPTPHMLHVAVQLQDPMLVVGLRAQEAAADASLPVPFVVRNDCTRFRVVVWQKPMRYAGTYQSVDTLPPLTSLAYVPDAPGTNPTVCLQLQSTLLSAPVAELDFVPQHALVNIEVTFDKPHRLPVVQIGKRRVWVDMVMDGTTKSIVLTDRLPGASEAHAHKRQAMLLKDWRHILRRIAQTTQLLATVAPPPPATPAAEDLAWTTCLWVVEARRLGTLVSVVRETFRPFVRVALGRGSKEWFPQKQAIAPVWLPQETDVIRDVLQSRTGLVRIEVRDADAIFGSTLCGFCELDVGAVWEHQMGATTLDLWCPLTSSLSGMPSPASVRIFLALAPHGAHDAWLEEAVVAAAVRGEVEAAVDCRDRFLAVLQEASLDVTEMSDTDGDRRSLTSLSTATSTASDDTLFDEKKQLAVVVLHVSSTASLDAARTYYCALESNLSTRCTTPAVPKDEPLTMAPRPSPLVLEFLGGQALGLDLVYSDGHVTIHGVDCDGQSGRYWKDRAVTIGDLVTAVNGRTIRNLSKDAAFAAIEAARSDAAVFTLTLVPTPAPPVVDVEWNRRLTFPEAKADSYLKVRLYERPREKDHGLSEEKESSVLPFLYFFGEDAILDDLDHSKAHRQTDRLVALCWVRVPDEDDDWVRLEHAHERICALYVPGDGTDLRIVGHVRLSLKWELIKPADTMQPALARYAQVEVGPLFVSLVDASEVLLASLTGAAGTPGIQISYGQLSDNRQVINVRLDHLQLDNQLVDTNYPVVLAPVRPPAADTLPTFQFMAVVNLLPAVVHFEYIFAQLQELEIKIEDFLLVAIAKVFANIDWSFQAPPRAASVYQLLAAQSLLADLHATEPTVAENKKVVLRWLLLCPIKLNVTFSSTTDQPLTHSILSPQMSPLLRNIIGAAAALVTNLDRAPIQIPEFYIESVFETKYALGFYVMQHYIVGSVDVLGNPIGLVSTLGAGVKDFFFTPAQMLLEDESGLRIENLRTGMTKGSKSLLRNTAVGIFHTTGKITETLGKGIALLAMDSEYNTQRQQRALKQATTISHLGDGIVEGGKDLAGGIWEGVRGVVVEPVIGAANDGAGGFIVGLGKGFAGLVVKPTAGILDLLTSVSHGVKVTAESMDARFERRGSHRVRLPRRFGPDGVLVAFSEREAKGSAILLLTGLDDEYVYHIEYGDEGSRGLVLLTNKRIMCLSKGQQLWEVALDSTLSVEAADLTLRVTAARKLFTIPCNASPRPFQVAVESLQSGSLQDTRYLLLNLEKGSKEAATDEGAAAADPLVEKVVLELSAADLQSQPIRSIRIELHDVLASFSVYRLLVLGGPYQWTVFRRFSEFRALHDALVGVVDTTSLPVLPPRHLFFSTRASIIKARQDALGLYLQAAIMHPPILHAPDMQRFLTHDASDIHVARIGLA
ncbi:vacuolar protein sorting-associated protein [Achlya hypogyna]|uniref:Vacuolar protein sorting-associated protein n=1 Tax=Achlya hypogyna TaxID=1202772 RepID=A0A1V9YQD6_ACHHY|nr:vacuolar protein sorting-associated protein [Achlya hypogyna]